MGLICSRRSSRHHPSHSVLPVDGKPSGHTSAPVPNSSNPTAGANRHDRGCRDNPLSMVLFATILQFYTSSTSPHNAINNNACILQYRTPPQSSGSFKFFVALWHFSDGCVRGGGRSDHTRSRGSASLPLGIVLDGGRGGCGASALQRRADSRWALC